MATLFNGGKQIQDGTIGLADLSATGTPSSTTYLRGDNTWSTVSATQPDITMDNMSPSTNQTITANYSAIINRNYTINTGLSLTIGTGAIFRIL